MTVLECRKTRHKMPTNFKVQTMPETTRSYVSLTPGDPAPWFHQRSSCNPRYAFDTAAGRYIVMCFFMTSRDAQAQTALRAVAEHRRMFDDERIAFFGVSVDPGDEKDGRVKEAMPGIRFLWDFDGL